MLKKLTAGLCIALTLAGCQNPNQIALKIGAPPSGADKLRQVEIQRFREANPTRLLVAATQTLQDLGYIVSQSAPDAGVLCAVKSRDAEETRQVAAQIALTVGLLALGVVNNPTWDKSQIIHVTFVLSPTDDPNTQQVRVSFDRDITNNHGVMWRTEIIKDADIYKKFYTHLAKSILLENRSS